MHVLNTRVYTCMYYVTLVATRSRTANLGGVRAVKSDAAPVCGALLILEYHYAFSITPELLLTAELPCVCENLGIV